MGCGRNRLEEMRGAKATHVHRHKHKLEFHVAKKACHNVEPTNPTCSIYS